nr:TolC family protein [Novosphingobium piscinae]
MARLHTANPTIAQAAARLAMARADARMTAAAGRPTLGLDASAAHASGPLVNAAGQSGDLFTARAMASWELDLLGRLSDERKAARQDVRAAEAALADATLLIEAAAARAWFARKSAALAAEDAGQAARARQDVAHIAEQRQGLGLIGLTEVEAARQQWQQAAARTRALQFARDNATRQLVFLLGSETADPAWSADTAGLPEMPPIPAGLPADLLDRRPDLRAAQARVAAADARLSAVHKGWLPPIALTAVQGQASTSLGQLFASASGVLGLGAVLALPIFDGGRQRARVGHGKAEKGLVEAEYRERVAGALRDVYDDLQAAQMWRAELVDARQRAGAGATLLAAAEVRAANGTIAYVQLLDARAVAFDRRIAASLIQGESLIRLVTLQAAIGGGW